MANVAPPPVMNPIAASAPFGPPPPAFPSGLDPAMSALAARIAAIRGAGLQGAGPLWTPQARPAPVNPVDPSGVGGVPGVPNGPQPTPATMLGSLMARLRAAQAAQRNPAMVAAQNYAASGGMPAPVQPQVMPNPEPAAPMPMPAGGGMGDGVPTPSIMPSGGFMGAFDPAGGNPFLQRPSVPKGPGY